MLKNRLRLITGGGFVLFGTVYRAKNIIGTNATNNREGAMTTNDTNKH